MRMSKKPVSLAILLPCVLISVGVFLLPSTENHKTKGAEAARPLAQPKPEASPTLARVKQSDNRKQIEKIIREYLLKNPEVLVEAMQVLEAKRSAERAAAVRHSIQENRKRIHENPEDPVGGNPLGDVTIVEFFDYRCGFCKRVAPTVEEALAKDKGIRIVYKEFPILGTNSVLAAKAALASRVQGKYVAFHEALMAAKISYDEKSIMEVAAGLGLDTARLSKDMQSPQIQATIDRNRALARSLNIRGTPAFIVGEQLFPGALTPRQLARMIQKARSNGIERR